MFKVRSPPHQSVFAISLWKLATEIAFLSKNFSTNLHTTLWREGGQTVVRAGNCEASVLLSISSLATQCAEPVLSDLYDSISPSVTDRYHISLQNCQEAGLINSWRIFWDPWKAEKKKIKKICRLVANAIWLHSFFQMCWYLFN